MSSSSSSLLPLEGAPRMSRSYSFQGIPAGGFPGLQQMLSSANGYLASDTGSIYDDSLYLQPVDARGGRLVRAGSGGTLESGGTLVGSATLSRQSSQSSLHSNSSALYAHILDSSMDKPRRGSTSPQGRDTCVILPILYLLFIKFSFQNYFL